MKRLWLTLLFASLTTPLIAQEAPKASPTPTPPPQTPKDQASYSIGIRVGKDLQDQGLDSETITPAMLARGIVDALTDAAPALTEEQMMAAMQEFAKTMQAKRVAMEAEQQKAGEKAKAEGEAFLAANAQKPGVKVLPSGLQYKVITAGTGASPVATDMVKVHYHGTLINGKMFDSSVERGEPAEFSVDRVIPGWTEALQLMKVGDKWQLYIPAALAYGERGAGGVIPPNSVLVFDVELLEIEK
jgi:FKBP-type peptidyl-prolyl cis-trans isomerase FklB